MCAAPHCATITSWPWPIRQLAAGEPQWSIPRRSMRRLQLWGIRGGRGRPAHTAASTPRFASIRIEIMRRGKRRYPRLPLATRAGVSHDDVAVGDRLPTLPAEAQP